MVMKSLIFVSVQAAEAWNARAAPALRISATRRPCASPTSSSARSRSSPSSCSRPSSSDGERGCVAAALWAFGVNAVTYQPRREGGHAARLLHALRVLLLRPREGRRAGSSRRQKRQPLLASAVSFGLMLASKYFPHYFGLNMLYHHYAKLQASASRASLRAARPPLFYWVVLATFLVANPALLLPQTWKYLAAYSSESLLTHTGYLMGETLYRNVDVDDAVRRHARLLLPALPGRQGAAARALRARRRASALRAALARAGAGVPALDVRACGSCPTRCSARSGCATRSRLMPFVYMMAAVGVVAMVRRAAEWLTLDAHAARQLRVVGRGAAVAVLVFVALPAWAAGTPRRTTRSTPTRSRHARAGHFFPHDEFYDDGLREAIQYVAEHAPAGRDHRARDAGRRPPLPRTLRPRRPPLARHLRPGLRRPQRRRARLRHPPARPHLLREPRRAGRPAHGQRVQEVYEGKLKGATAARSTHAALHKSAEC